MPKLMPAVLAALVCACGSSGSPKPVTRVTYAIDLDEAADADPQHAGAARAQALEQAVATVRARIRSQGVAGAQVAARGERIVVELPGLDDDRRAAVKDVIARTGALAMKLVDNDAPAMARLAEVVAADPDAAARAIAVRTEQWRTEDGATAGDRYLTADDREEQVPIEEARRMGCFHRDQDVAGGQVRCMVTGRQAIRDYLRALGEREPSLRLPDDHEVGYERIEPAAVAAAPSGRRPCWRTYYLEREARLTGREIAGTDAVRDRDSGRPEILVTFDDRGREQLAALTRANVGKKLAILIDDVVRIAPIVQAPITGGRVTLTLGGSDSVEDEARALANVLRAGALPAPLREESIEELGPARPAH